MQKMFVNRPLFYATLAFGFGIFLARPIFSANILIIITTLLAFGMITYLCFKYACVYRLMVILACFIIGLGAFFVSIASLDAKDFGDNELLISGRTSVITTYDYSQNVVLDNVYVNGEKLGKNITVYISETTEIAEGCIITFESALTKTNFFSFGEFNSYNYKYNIAYSANISVEEITIDGKDVLDWSEKLRRSVKNLLFNNMGETEAGVCYASLFGDKALIPQETKNAFSTSGIAHLLAVSGLHIGFIVVVLKWLLKLFKINNYAQYVIILTTLGLYCYICAFSASVLRATIMFAVAGLWGLFGHKNDSLSTLSFTALICLIFRPLSVYDGGFLLSFACVFCIFMFSTTLQKKMENAGLPRWLASTLGVLLPVQVGLIPLLSNYFSSVSFLSIVANFICVPLFEAFFMILFVIVPVALIIPSLGGLLIVPGFLINGIIASAKFVEGIQWAIINLTAFASVTIVGIYVAGFIFSQFFHLKNVKQGVYSTSIIFLALLFGVLGSFKVAPNNSKISVISAYDKTAYCLELGGKSFAIGSFNKSLIDKTKEYAMFSRLYSIDYYISFSLNMPNSNDTFKNMYNKENIKSIPKNLGGVSVSIECMGENVMGIILEWQDVKIFVVSDIYIGYGQAIEFATYHDDINFVIGDRISLLPYIDYLNYDYLILDGNNLLDKNQSICFSNNGNWCFEINNNEIYNMRGVD